MKNVFRTLKLFARGEVHLHIALTTLFVVLLFTSSLAAITYTYVQTSNAALRSAWQMMRTTNHAIYRDVLRYLGTAKRTSASVAWAIEGTRTIHEDGDKMLPVLSGVLRAQREVFAVSVGDASGSLLMVGRIFDDPRYSVNKSKSLPPEVKYRIHRVDLLSTPKTDRYEYLAADMRLIDEENVPTDAIQYDARTKRWYREAEDHKSNAWTDVALYPNGQFGTSNVEPVLNPDGSVRLAVSATIALSLQDGITTRLNVAQNGIAFVLDEAGELIIHPDRSKITRCEADGKCRFNKVNEIGEPALALAYERYKERSDLKHPDSTPKRLNYREYSAAVARLEPPLRSAFDQLYRLDDTNQTILLREKVPESAREALPRILAAIAYTYIVRISSGGQEYLASFHGFPGHYGKPWTVGAIVPINDFIGGLKQTLARTALLSVAILLVAVVVIVFAARRILRPLALISQDMNRIQQLEIDESMQHRSIFYEIDTIGNALGSMKHGLKSFSKFVPVTLVKQLIASGAGAELGGEKRRLTMMFTDIEGFTTISESMRTEALLQHISEYLDSLTSIILGQSGTVDKYIGDAIMSFWGAPVADPEHEIHACRAALLCAARLETLNAKWASEGKPELRTRFGISTGDVSVGNMGSSERMNYTVLGDAVNLASRLEGINKYYGTRIIVGEDTYAVAKDHFLMRPVDVVAVKGKARGVCIYELLAGLPGDPALAPTADDERCQQLTKQAFDAFLKRDFHAALALYEQLVQAFPRDAIGPMFMKRCTEYLVDPPGDDWTGVTKMTTK